MAGNSFLHIEIPDAMGFQVDRWDALLQYAEKLCITDQVPGLAFQVQRGNAATPVMKFGRRQLMGSESIIDDTWFLVASLTKPMLATAILLLVERGEIALNQRVTDLIPEFKRGPKKTITIRHLLTHTSGLPDMLSNNVELRQAQSSLLAFVEGTCKADLGYTPGRGAIYQSMGYALLGRILELVTQQDYRKFIREQLFEPIGMKQSWLGLPEDKLTDPNIAEVRCPPEFRDGTEWNWNSNYWKTFGAPWGGLISTVHDVSLFCRWVLNDGVTAHGDSLLSPSLLQLATSNRLGDFPEMPAAERRTRGWGYGWRMNWVDHRGTFCDLIGPDAFGHWGATGTVMWIDRSLNMATVILSTQPLERNISPLVNLSNMIVAALKI